MMKFKTVVLCLKQPTCLIVQRSFGNVIKRVNESKTLAKYASSKYKCKFDDRKM